MSDSIKNLGLSQSKVTDAPGAPLDPKVDRELRRVGKEFESFFLLKLRKTMQATIPNQSKSVTYVGMFDLNFAEYLSRAGNFSLGDMIYEQLQQQVRNLSPGPAPTQRGESEKGNG